MASHLQHVVEGMADFIVRQAKNDSESDELKMLLSAKVQVDDPATAEKNREVAVVEASVSIAGAAPSASCSGLCRALGECRGA